ncbi:MAG: hypothetical protein COA79_15215 [Planctomycetota bacterium]|nr:MAG: hypothetical protein COA79_15215 [Planctomycetota bacterium]
MYDLDEEPALEVLNESMDYIRSLEGKLFDRIRKDPNDSKARASVVMLLREIHNLKMKILTKKFADDLCALCQPSIMLFKAPGVFNQKLF